MDFGSGDEQEASNSRRGKKPYHRHTAHQTHILEGFFKENPHPDDKQRSELSRELGLEPKQIKFWFQNKRTQTKAQNERADNSALRAENERMQCENLAIREAMKSVICPACGGPPFGEENRGHCLEKLQIENAQLKRELERSSNLVGKFLGKPVPQLLSTSRGHGSSMDFPTENLTSNLIRGPSLDLELPPGNPINPQFPFNGIQEMEKSVMVETAVNAMSELIKLLRVNEPLWIKSSTHGRIVIHRDSYDKLFPNDNYFRSSTARIESSKYSGVVMVTGMHLIDMFLDSRKWVDLFPTIVTKARTIGVLDTGLLGNQGDSLQLVYEQMHILSPLVAPREFYFLRYSQQLETDVWAIVDVSYDILRENSQTSSIRSWRFPSGCMIQDMSNGYSRVTWVEHVEVDDKSLTHRLYRDVVCSCEAYGAERWIVSLQRMCERFAFSIGPSPPSHELKGVINMPEGRRSIMKLSHRMVKSLCSILSMTEKIDFRHSSELKNSGIRVSIRKSDEQGQPGGMIVSAATTLWLPLPFETLFNFFRDEKMRVQWDVLSNGNPVNEVAQISTGAHPGNRISILQPFVPSESNMLMLQESCTDQLGGLVVYAPIDVPSVKNVVNGEDSTNIPILPSGLVISGDGRPDQGTGASGGTSSSGSCGSLVTVAFQILVCSGMPSKQLDMESVATVNTLISSTVQKIKVALDCTDLD